MRSDPAGTRVVINVADSKTTGMGDSSQPGYLEGYRVSDAEQVRELAVAALLRLANAETVWEEALGYQPSAALERAARCWDLTRRFPGCSRPPVVCGIDHTASVQPRGPEGPQGDRAVEGQVSLWLIRPRHQESG
jgi:hypothetical protein